MPGVDQSPGQRRALASVVAFLCAGGISARAATAVFFNAGQSSHLVATNATSDTFASEGYLFTVSRDKLFTVGIGLTNPIGRVVQVSWPEGLEAQAVTAGPPPGKARIDIKRQDDQTFDRTSFMAKLLANTAGAGAAIEIMPLVNGEDELPDPVMCAASGYCGQSFSFHTPLLTGFDAYQITLYVDFALTAITLVDTSEPPPVMLICRVDNQPFELTWPVDAGSVTLESSPDLSNGMWSIVVQAPDPQGTSYVLRLAASESTRLSRLRK